MPDSEKLCFVIMPFKDELKSVYSQAIKPAVIKCGFDCLRVDELKMGPFNIHRKIIEYIYRSKVIVADLSQWNPNVYYEMGVAHSIDNKTLMIVQKGERLPFDISTYHVIQYEPTEAGLVELRQQIQENLACFEEWRKWPTNPVQDFRPFDAFVPKTELENLKNLMADRDRLLRESVPHQTFEQKVKELTDANQTLAQKQNHLEKLQAKFQDLERRYTQIFCEREMLQEQIAQLERDDQTQTLHTLQQQVRELDAARQKLAAERAQLEQELAAAQTEKARQEKRATEYSRQNARLKQLNTPNSWAHWLTTMNWYGLGAVILVPLILLNLFLFNTFGREYKLNSSLTENDTTQQVIREPVIAEDKLKIQPSISPVFRDTSKTLSQSDVKAVLKKFDFYCGEYSWSKDFCNPDGRGFANNYKVQKIADDSVVVDQNSGLMWQQGGLSNRMDFETAKKWIDDLNQRGYAGYSDWRLPTLEEAMSLVERAKMNGGLYIDPIFDKTQRYIWTADPVAGSATVWVVYFYSGYCNPYYLLYDIYLRAVRSGQSSQG